MCRHYHWRHIGPCPCPYHSEDHDGNPVGVLTEYRLRCMEPKGRLELSSDTEYCYYNLPNERFPWFGDIQELTGYEKHYELLNDFCDDCQEVYEDLYAQHEETKVEPFKRVRGERPEERLAPEPEEHEEGYSDIDRRCDEALYREHHGNITPLYSTGREKQAIWEAQQERLHQRTPTPEPDPRIYGEPFDGCSVYRYEKDQYNQRLAEEEEEADYERHHLVEKHAQYGVLTEDVPKTRREYDEVPAAPVDEEAFYTSQEYNAYCQDVMQDQALLEDKDTDFDGDWETYRKEHYLGAHRDIDENLPASQSSVHSNHDPRGRIMPWEGAGQYQDAKGETVPAYEPTMANVEDFEYLPKHQMPLPQRGFDWFQNLPESAEDFYNPELNRHEVPDWHDDYQQLDHTVRRLRLEDRY